MGIGEAETEAYFKVRVTLGGGRGDRGARKMSETEARFSRPLPPFSIRAPLLQSHPRAPSLQGRPYNWFRVKIAIPESQKDSHPANKVSTIKYTLLKQIIQVRWTRAGQYHE